MKRILLFVVLLSATLTFATITDVQRREVSSQADTSLPSQWTAVSGDTIRIYNDRNTLILLHATVGNRSVTIYNRVDSVLIDGFRWVQTPAITVPVDFLKVAIVSVPSLYNINGRILLKPDSIGIRVRPLILTGN